MSKSEILQIHIVLVILVQLLTCSIITGFGHSARPSEIKIWEHAVVPYKISTKFNGDERPLILQAFAEISQKTCIKFIPCCLQNETDFIHVKKGPGCFSAIGRHGGEQVLSLGIRHGTENCVHPGMVEHYLMETLGFYHEHLRPDRDEYVYIMQRNIKAHRHHNFAKHQTALFNTDDIPYDYSSVTHGDNYDFSANGKKTIIPKYSIIIGQRNGLSEGDVRKINHVYCSSAIERVSNIFFLINAITFVFF